MGKFWMSDDFVRVHARKLSTSAVAVYMVLSCHCNRHNQTTIGVRRVAEILGVSKTTVVKAMKELKVYQFLVQRTKGVYQIRVPGVPVQSTEVYQDVVHKEEFKEVYKEGFKSLREQSSKGEFSPAKEALARKLGLR